MLTSWISTGCDITALNNVIDLTSSSEPNRSMSSSSSSFKAEAGVEVEVVSATPAGPYWPRGFFTPGRLSGDGVYVTGLTLDPHPESFTTLTCSSGPGRTWCGCTSGERDTGRRRGAWRWPRRPIRLLGRGHTWRGGASLTVVGGWWWHSGFSPPALLSL